jgi:hypothetical protein
MSQNQLTDRKTTTPSFVEALTRGKDVRWEAPDALRTVDLQVWVPIMEETLGELKRLLAEVTTLKVIARVDIEGQDYDEKLIHGAYQFSGCDLPLEGYTYGPDRTWLETRERMQHCFALEIQLDIIFLVGTVETGSRESTVEAASRRVDTIIDTFGKPNWKGSVDERFTSAAGPTIAGFRCSVQDFGKRLKMYEVHRGSYIKAFIQAAGEATITGTLTSREIGKTPIATAAQITGLEAHMASPPDPSRSRGLSPSMIIRPPLCKDLGHVVEYALCVKQSIANELSKSIVRIRIEVMGRDADEDSDDGKASCGIWYEENSLLPDIDLIHKTSWIVRVLWAGPAPDAFPTGTCCWLYVKHFGILLSHDTSPQV